MTDYKTIEQGALIELLARYTADYTKLLTENGDRLQLDKLHKEINAIQKEVYYRRKLKSYTDTSSDYISFGEGDVV